MLADEVWGLTWYLTVFVLLTLCRRIMEIDELRHMQRHVGLFKGLKCRVELLGSGKGSLASALLAHCTATALDLLKSPFASDILVELCHGDCTGWLWETSEPEVRLLHEAIAKSVTARDADSMDVDPTDTEGPSPAPEEPAMEHYFASRALLQIINAPGAAEGCHAAQNAFCETLWELAVKPTTKSLITTHAVKIVAALSNCSCAPVAKAVRQELKSCVNDVDAWCAGGWKAKSS